MAIKKSDLYSSLWASCDELRGDMVALTGKSDIGDKINTQIIQPLVDANSRLTRTDFPDFNDPNKLGEGADKVQKLSNLVAIFEDPALDDILGDAYEYLMRHFAQRGYMAA
jgi:type I restriction enzyme M protein